MTDRETAPEPVRAPALVERLIFAAEDVAARWSIIRATDGKLGDCGLPDALESLGLVLDELDLEDANVAAE